MMDLGLGGLGSEEGGERKKHRKDDGDKGKNGGKVDEKVVTSMAKLCLANSMQIRALRQIVMECIRIPTDCELVESSAMATKAYSDRVREMKDQGVSQEDIKNRMGIPHVHIWNAMLKTLREKITDGTKAQKIDGYIETLRPVGWKGIAKDVRYVRVAKTYQKEYKRLEISVRPSTMSAEVWCIMHEALLELKGAKDLEGMAPPRDLEHKLQDWLDDKT